MDGFINYLLKIGNSNPTIKQHIRFVEVFNSWLDEKSIKVEECGYTDLVQFIDFVTEYYSARRNTKNTINRVLVAIEAFYDYLIMGLPDLRNPARNIRVKNPIHRMVHDLLDKDELDLLYESIKCSSVRNVRNKVILGFLIFQGLTTNELHRIRLADLKLRKGTIFISDEPHGKWKRGSASRELDLEALQIIDLIDYIENCRSKILRQNYRIIPGRKPDKPFDKQNFDQLLLSINGSSSLKNSLLHLFIELRRINPKVRNATQIRQSVMSNWLKRLDLRTVQYLAGHRYVSSTEYYKQIDLHQLKRCLEEFHPMK